MKYKIKNFTMVSASLLMSEISLFIVYLRNLFESLRINLTVYNIILTVLSIILIYLIITEP